MAVGVLEKSSLVAACIVVSALVSARYAATVEHKSWLAFVGCSLLQPVEKVCARAYVLASMNTSCIYAYVRACDYNSNNARCINAE